MKQIQDEFTNLNVSRQRKYQLRCQRDHLCIVCGSPTLVTRIECERHSQQRSMQNARSKGSTIRKFNSRWGKRGERFDKEANK